MKLLPPDDAARLLAETGLLFEINRRVLHPVGLALVVNHDTTTLATADGAETRDSYTLAGLQDAREIDRAGFTFGDDDLDEGGAKLSRFMTHEGHQRHVERLVTYGFVVQPMPCMVASEPDPDAVSDAFVQEFVDEHLMGDDVDLDRAKVESEMHDFFALQQRVAKVYMAVTGGRISLPTTRADDVIDVAQSWREEECDRAAEQTRAELQARALAVIPKIALASVRDELRAALNLPLEETPEAIRAALESTAPAPMRVQALDGLGPVLDRLRANKDLLAPAAITCDSEGEGDQADAVRAVGEAVDTLLLALGDLDAASPPPPAPDASALATVRRLIPAIVAQARRCSDAGHAGTMAEEREEEARLAELLRQAGVSKLEGS